MASDPHLVHVDGVDAREHDVGELAASRRRLGAAAGAHGIGVSLWAVPPGRRSTPPHVHADEDEVFFVLRGSGISVHDKTAYAVGAGDALLHLADAEAHTLVAGPDGLDVLMFGEGSRTSLTYLPRTRQFWAGRRWIPADSPHPFAADAELGPLELPPVAGERPATIVALADAPAEREDRPGYEGVDRNLTPGPAGRHVGLRHVTLEPGAWSCPPHFHQAEEEAFHVLDGDGEALLGDVSHPIGAGSFLVRPPNSGIPHALRAGPAGLTYLAFGTRVPNELCFYPRSQKLGAGGWRFRPELLDYWDGEP
jgi:uncharacterized cupin superfamily protein